MNDSDPVEEFLLRPEPLRDAGPLRERLFEETTRALRLKRRRRRLVRLGCLAGIYLVGLLTLPVLTPRPNPVPSQPEPVSTRTVREEIPDASTRLEWEALLYPEQASGLYRQAGDQYMDKGDLRNAVRCYGNALEKQEAWEVSSEDSWLLMVIKQARKKESLACAEH